MGIVAGNALKLAVPEELFGNLGYFWVRFYVYRMGHVEEYGSYVCTAKLAQVVAAQTEGRDTVYGFPRARVGVDLVVHLEELGSLRVVGIVAAETVEPFVGTVGETYR